MNAEIQSGPVQGAVCIPNIGPKGRRKRMVFGLVALTIGIVAAALMIASGTGRWWRLLLVLPFWMAGLGYFQARGHT